MGVVDSFTEGRNVDDWLAWLWDEARKRAKVNDIELPDYKAFVVQEFHKLAAVGKPRVMFSEFRSDPEKYPLATPSGRIELFSERVAAFGYEDCHGHATWNDPDEWLGNASADFPQDGRTFQQGDRVSRTLKGKCSARAANTSAHDHDAHPSISRSHANGIERANE